MFGSLKRNAKLKPVTEAKISHCDGEMNDAKSRAVANSASQGDHIGKRLQISRLFPVAALFVPLAILAYVGWLNWRAVWQDAEIEVQRAALSASEYGQRTLESYSFAAGRLNDRLQGLSDADIRLNEYDLHLELARIGTELSQAELAYVVDRDGFPLVASNLYPIPKGISLADREYFQALRAPSRPPVHISQTFIGRFDGRLFFSVARARTGSGNQQPAEGFDGVVLVSVSPDTLAEGMRRLLPTSSDRMAFMRTDGFGISVTSGLADARTPLPKVDDSDPFYSFVRQGARSATYLSETAMPGTTALLAMQLVAGFPIYAVAIRPSAEVIARWRKVMLPHIAFGLPATLGLFLLSFWVWQDQLRLAEMNAALRLDNELTADRLGRSKRFGLVGTFEYDLQTGVSRRSAEYMSVHGLPARAANETHYDWANRLHPDDRQRAERELQRVLFSSAETEYGQTYRIVTPSGQTRWIAARGEITRDKAGRALLMRGAHVDVTPLRSTELALAESDARLRLAQDSLGIGTWEWVRATRSLTGSRKFRELCNLDPDATSLSLEEALSSIHPDDRRSVRKTLATARRNGGFRDEFRILRKSVDGTQDVAWVAVRAVTTRHTQAADERVVGIAYDITDRKRAEELTNLMAREIEHRAKNALTVVSSLLRMTKSDSPLEFAKILDGRIRALSRTMGLLGKGQWQGANLREIVESQLEPFFTGATGLGTNIAIEGPHVTVSVDSAQPIAMALHELATNAAKYGALSVETGRLLISWSVQSGQVHLRWKELGGPTLDGSPPTRGFGSRLITMLFNDQIGGAVVKHWKPEGLVCEMTFSARP